MSLHDNREYAMTTSAHKVGLIHLQLYTVFIEAIAALV
jgi:hypothetical protein